MEPTTIAARCGTDRHLLPRPPCESRPGSARAPSPSHSPCTDQAHGPFQKAHWHVFAKGPLARQDPDLLCYLASGTCRAPPPRRPCTVYKAHAGRPRKFPENPRPGLALPTCQCCLQQRRACTVSLASTAIHSTCETDLGPPCEVWLWPILYNRHGTMQPKTRKEAHDKDPAYPSTS